MQYITDFYESLGNKYTVLLIAFITGFVIGASRIVGSSVLIGLLVGVVFAVAAGLLVAVLDNINTKNITINIDLAPLITIVLLIILFYVITSQGLNNIFANVEKSFNYDTTKLENL